MGLLRPVLSAFLAACLVAATVGTELRAADRNLVIAAAKAQPAVEPRIALVIGNSDYPNAPLANPVNDARAIAARLGELRFRVTRLENASQEQMYEAIRAFGDQLRGGGVGLFYYSGHALQVRGRNYLLPARAMIQREDEILYRTVDTGLILDKMESARNRVNVMILDACRNSPFGREFRTVSPGLAVVDAPYNTLIAFATAPGAVASDGSGRNGLYTQHLLQSLADRGLDLEDVFKKVRSGVRQESAGRQVPWESTSLEVDFFFDPLPHQTVAATPAAPDPLTLELAFWDSVKGSTDPEDYRAYLKRYPDGQFAVLASNRLRALAPSAPAAPTAPAAPAPTSTQPTAASTAAPATAATPVRPPATAASPTPPLQTALVPPAAAQAPSTAPAAPAPAPGPAPVPMPVFVPAPAPAPLAVNTVPAPTPFGAAPVLVPLRALAGHTGALLAIAVSRSATQALTGAADRSLRLWDLASGKELRVLAGHAADVTAAAIAPNRRLLLSGSADRSVRLWDAASGAQAARMDGHAAAVSAVAFGPTTRYAVSAADDGELILWEVPDGKLIRRARADERRVCSVALSPEGRYLLTGSDDGAVRLWDVGSLRVVRSFGPMSAPTATVAFSEDGRRVNAVDTRGEVWSWEAQSGVSVRRLGTGSVSPVLAAIAVDGATALTAGADGQLVLWDMASGRPLWRSSAPDRRFTAVALGPRGTMGLSASDDKRLLLWDTGMLTKDPR